MGARFCQAVGTLALVLGLSGCEQSGSSGAPLAVQYAGCTRVIDGPACLVQPGDELVLWVQTEADVRVELDGVPVTATPVPVDEGQRHTVTPGSAAQLVIATGTSARAPRWTLALQPINDPDVIQQAHDLKREGRFREALKLLDPELPRIPDAHRGRALALVARLEYGLGRNEQAIAHARDAIELHRPAGQASDLVKDSMFLAQMLLEDGRFFGEAIEVVDAVPDQLPGHLASRFHLNYYRGLIASHLGDHRRALSHYRRAAQSAERWGSDTNLVNAEQQVADSLQLLGRYLDAVELQARPLLSDAGEGERDPSECATVRWLGNYAWGLLLAMEAGQDPVTWTSESTGTLGADPTPILEQALEELGPHCIDAKSHEVNLLVNLALAAIHQGNLEAADAWLDQAVDVDPKMEFKARMWARELQGRIALAEGHGREAERIYHTLGKAAGHSSSLEWSWKSWRGRAQALEIMGRTDEAIKLYDQGSKLIFKQSLLVPVNVGRDAFLARQEQINRRHLRLLLDKGKVGAAFDVARTLRAQYLGGLHSPRRVDALRPGEREQWERSVAEYRRIRAEIADLEKQGQAAAKDAQARILVQLRRLGREANEELDRGFAAFTRRFSDKRRNAQEGELLLGFFETDEGWVGFCKDHKQRVWAAELGAIDVDADADALGAQLLGPFATQIGRARRITLLPTGGLRDIDLHALPYDGAELQASKLVAYSLDLSAKGRPGTAAKRPSSTVRKAVVVADPRGDLPGALSEGKVIGNLLASSVKTVQLVTGDAAEADGVLEALDKADLLHYAGHGVFGDDGWDAELLLAGGTTLTVSDVLALPKAPDVVVLSGCETGRSQSTTVENLGVAQAFVAAGSRVVVAAARPVPDMVALRFSEAMYVTAPESGPGPREVQQALATVRDPDAPEDWRSFRVFLP